MKKKSVITRPVPHEQTDALRRLAQSGKVQEALDRLDVLKAQHPDFKLLYSLAFELASMGDNSYKTVERALDWTQASPNSRVAWQSLFDTAYANGYMAIGLHAGLRLAALEGQSSDEFPEDFDTPFGKMRFEEAIANDRARIFMANGRFDQALTVLADFDHVSLRNNVALIHFYQGDIVGALSLFEENWQREPGNLFALENIIRLRLWTRGIDFAAGLAAPMKATPALRSDDALAKVTALLILGDWQGADTAWRESAEADFWQGPKETKLSADFDFAGGIAALRLKDFEAMSERFDMAIKNQPDRRNLIKGIEFATTLSMLGEAPDLSLGEMNRWFPQHWLDQIFKIKSLRGQILQDRFDGLISQCDAHPDYLCRIAELHDEKGRFLALSVLKLRARNGDKAAEQAMIGLLARPCGSDKVRADLHAELVNAGVLLSGGTVSMLTQGQVREMRHMVTNIHAKVSPSNLPPESHARLGKVFDLLAKKRFSDCIPIIEDLIARHPEVPLLYNNLAGIKEGMGIRDEEVEALLQKAYALDPDYFFAIAGLARFAARRGEIERAKSMIEPLLGRDSYHFTEWRSLLMTQLELAKGQGEFGAVLNLKKQLSALQERFG